MFPQFIHCTHSRRLFALLAFLQSFFFESPIILYPTALSKVEQCLCWFVPRCLGCELIVVPNIED